MHVGQRIKELREAQRMLLTELSKKSGVQIATLSRIENLKMTGTLDSHMAIAKALGVDLPHLYRDLESKAQAKAEKLTAKSHSDVFVHSDKSSYEILTSKLLNKKMMPVLLKIESGGRTNKEQNQLGTEKFIFILEGSIKVVVDKEEFALTKNNTLYFDASLPYYMENTGKALAKVLCIGTPVAL